MKTIRLITVLFVGVLILGQGPSWAASPPAVSADEARAIAKEAYIYGYPMVDGYRVMYTYFQDSENPEFKAPWNQIRNIPRVFTPDDRAIVAPNSDTPYSMAGLLLRAEPIVLTVPPIEKERYFSVQLIDAYTFNFDYIGSRATGNDGGSFLIAGPGWKGETPAGIRKVFRSETDLVLAAYRTQLFHPDDIENVKKVQAGYKVQPLSAFLGTPAPAAGAAVEFMPPLSIDDQKTYPEFFNVLNFVLEFGPTHPSETELMARFAKIGVGAGKRINIEELSPEMKQALAAGMADAWDEFNSFDKTHLRTNKVASGDLFGTREFLQNNYLYRFVAAVIGLYGNSKEEAMYPFYRADADGEPLDAAKHRYTLRFAPGQLPPVHAFWSATMYGLPENLLVANPINRYLINSPMLSDLKRDEDGGLTLYFQADSPGAELESNWLPAPKGPFWVALRLYWPKEEALNGTWQQPPLMRVQDTSAEQAAGLQNPVEIQIENFRGKPHYEVLIMNRNTEGPGGAGHYYNSLGLTFDVSDEEMDARFLALDPEKLKQEYGGDGVRFNGPRRFLVNRLSALAFDGGKKAMLGPIPMYLYGTFVVPDFDAFMTGTQAPYRETVSKRNSTFHYAAGEEVYELVSPEGAVFTMFSASLRVDPNNTIDRLPTLGERLSLPDGWKYRVRTLEKEMVLGATYDSDPPNTIVLDQFENNYQRNRTGQ